MPPLDDQNWTLHPLDSPPDRFGAFADVVAQWQAKRDGLAVPRWTDYEVRDFAGWYGRVSLCRLEPASADVFYELFGTTTAEWVGCDLTGKALSHPRLGLDAPARALFFGHFSGVIGRPAIGFRKVRLSFLDRHHIHGEAIDLPVAKATSQPTHAAIFVRRLS